MGTRYYFCHVYEVLDGELMFLESFIGYTADDLAQKVKKKYNHNTTFKERSFESFLEWYYRINPDANEGISLGTLQCIAKKFVQ